MSGRQDDETCPEENYEPSQNNLPGTNLTLRQLFIVVGGVATVVTILKCSVTFLSHFLWRSNYREQKHLVRVAILPAVFAGFYWLGLVFYGRQTYLSPWVGIFEVYTITCFFEYMIEILVPDGQTREEYMIAAPRMNRNRKRQKHEYGTYRWYKFARMFVYFGLFFHTITTILEMIIARALCHASETYESAYTFLEVLGIIFTFFALGALLRTYSRFSAEYQKHNLFRTFWVFKGIVLLYMVETFLIRILVTAGAVQPTRYMSQADFDWGVQSFMVCGQSCIFSFGYLKSLSGWRYRRGGANNRQGYAKMNNAGGTPEDYTKGRLLIDVFLPREPFSGLWESFKTLFGLCRGRRGFDYTADTGIGHRQRVEAAAVGGGNFGGSAYEGGSFGGSAYEPARGGSFGGSAYEPARAEESGPRQESDEHELLPRYHGPPGRGEMV